MLIDGFTTFAQMINFLILVFLLKRFLYGPVTRAMEDREKKIAEAVAQAQIAERKSKERSAELAVQLQTLIDTKEKFRADAISEIEKWREKKMNDLKVEINDLRQSWIDKLDHDQKAFLLKLKKDTIRHIVKMGDKVLRDLADRNLQNLILKVFFGKMESEMEVFQNRHYAGLVRVISGFELSEKEMEEFRSKLHQWFPSLKKVRFEISGRLGMGIEVLAGDKKAA